MGKLMSVMAFTGILAFSNVGSPALADNFYGALDFGQPKVKDICVARAGCDDTATLVRGAGGYQFAPMWSAEISYGPSRKASIAGGSWEADVLQVSGIGTFPIHGGFALTGKLGLARTDVTVTAAGFSTSTGTSNAAFGIGVRYDFTDKFAVRAQYEDFGKVDVNVSGVNEEHKATSLSAGAILKF